MAVVRRNAGWFSLAGIVLCTCLVVGWMVARAPSAAAVAMLKSYPPLNEVAWWQIDELRRENGLDDDMLAATDATTLQLHNLLAAVRGWHETNLSAWLTKHSAVADQRALIRQFQSAINMGQDRMAELAAARQQLTRLESDYETLVAGLRQSAATGLSTEQRTLTQRMYARRGIPMPFRVLDLSARQDRDLKQARSRYYQRLAVTRDRQQRAAIRSAYQQELETAIGTANVQVLGTLRGYLGPASQRVVTAVQLVLAPEG